MLEPVKTESTGPEPPRRTGLPAVREEGPWYETYSVPLKDGMKPANDQCSATFTNLSDREVRILVDAKSYPVAKDATVQVEVARQFIWRLEGREPQSEQVRMGEYSLQIVIRR